MNLNDMARMGTTGQPGAPREPGQGQPPAGRQAPTAKQQAQFDMLLGRARQMMGGMAREWKDAMQIDPARAAVRLGTQTLRFLAMESEKAGQPVDPAVLLHVGMQFVKDIAGLANDAGMVPDEQLEPFLQQVMQESIAEYMSMDAKEGLMPPPGGAPGVPAPPAPGPEGVSLAPMAQMAQMAQVAQVAPQQGGVQ